MGRWLFALTRKRWSTGYSVAYLRTRERDVVYSLLEHPGDGVGGRIALPMFCSFLLALSELQKARSST